MSDQHSGGCACKIGRAIKRYDLYDLNEELIHKREEDNMSLRALTDVINKRILSTALHQDDLPTGELTSTFSGENLVSNIYDVLTDDGVASDKKARVRTRLDQQDIDIMEIESDWVTHPTVRTHLNDCLDIDTSRSANITPQEAISTVEWGRTRANEVVKQTVDRLQSANELSEGDYSVTVQVRISCPDCGSSYRPDELIQYGGCDCKE